MFQQKLRKPHRKAGLIKIFHLAHIPSDTGTVTAWADRADPGQGA